jgi:DNA primase
MLRYNEEIIEEIKNRNDIVDVISQYVLLKRCGRNFFGLCPFHKEKTPSFSVSPEKQIFHCFGCGEGGNVIHFLSKIENIDFKESIETLANKAGVQLPTSNIEKDNKEEQLKKKIYKINEIVADFYHKNIYKEEAKKAQEYVKKRQLNNKTLKNFNIGYANNSNNIYKMLKEQSFTDEEILKSDLVIKKGNQYIDRFSDRLIFPIQDIQNRFIAFGARTLEEKKLPKYINSSETLAYIKGRNLYSLNIAKKSSVEKLIVVEGYMDVISLYQRGIENVVASLGTALTEAQRKTFKKIYKTNNNII